MIDPRDMTHPRNHPCSRCGATPGQLCQTKTGRAIQQYEELHAPRHALVRQWIDAQRTWPPGRSASTADARMRAQVSSPG